MKVKQEKGSKDLILFSASAVEIDRWVGIPQRLNLKGNETAGFQRTVSRNREEALRKFFAEERNVIQNPLLCAIRQAPGVEVSFSKSACDDDLGHVEISFPDYNEKSLIELLREARLYLEDRAPFLKDRVLPPDVLSNLQEQMPADALPVDQTLEEDWSEETESDEDAAETAEPAEEALFDESQITDFWDQLRAREEIVGKLEDANSRQELLGFSRQILESYLRPVILVDGQHRLRGAVLAASDEVNNSNVAEDMILDGQSVREAKEALLVSKARKLPVSLLMDASPAEHVFQYVLVNQKATPVPRALLGTIISTSLAANELEKIATRLEAADIQLQGSRIISILSRAEDSPFAGLVAKGLDDEGIDKLQWSVLGSLADMFRYLQGGRYYHEPTDHAKIWKKHHLNDSPITKDWNTGDYSDAYAYWQDLNGPWMGVFKAFWTKVREVLATADNEDAPHYWGNPRDSNIFNKPSLHILAADFFAYLKERKIKLESEAHIASLVDEWLEYASKNYFARDWRLKQAGIKKDSVGTRKQWSKLWVSHRQNGQAPPSASEFVKPYKG